ncbi:MAG: phosphomannomutase/phosphoglucomutase [Patescibacteria group bacterium]
MIAEQIFKAYDIRGRYPSEINEATVRAIANAYTYFLRPRVIVLGRDVRKSGPQLMRAVKNALVQSGVNVIDIGVVPVDTFYFAVGYLRVDGGIFVSASHNPREWNGMNLARRNARPISSESGLLRIRDLAKKGVVVRARRRGKVTKKNILDQHLDFLGRRFPIVNARPTVAVINGNFGVSAKFFESYVRRNKLPFQLIGLNHKPNGKFPKGPPDPLLLENRLETSRLVKRTGADLGIAWDADGDRVFFIDDRGRFLESCFVGAILASEILKLNPKGAIIVDTRVIYPACDAVRRAGGRLIVSRPGMTLIAERMRRERAVFASEFSGHFFFREAFNRDSGLLPAILLLNFMFRQKKKLSVIAEPFFKKYFLSGEINFHLASQENARHILSAAEKFYKGGRKNHIDGLSMEYPDWRFNLRPSNTEALLRLNVEARDRTVLRKRTKELRRFVLKHSPR